MRQSINILFSSCGRRVELLRQFRQALQARSGGLVLGCDTNPLAAALREADKAFIVPGCMDNAFIPRIQEICKDESVDMVILLIDTELGVYAESKNRFMEIGTRIVVSDSEVIEICNDKVKTSSFFEEIGIPYLRTIPIEEFKDGLIGLPAVLKPRNGSGGKDIYIVNSYEDIDVLRMRIDDPVLQELARGQEVTIDCLMDFEGKPLRFIMRERLEIRAGESSKGRTFKDRKLAGLLELLFSRLNTCGPVTVQCFQEKGEYIFTEINPRFGRRLSLGSCSWRGFSFYIAIAL